MVHCAHLPSSAKSQSTANELVPRIHLFKQRRENQQRVKSGSQGLLEEKRGIYMLQKTIVAMSNLEQCLEPSQYGRALHCKYVTGFARRS